MKGKIKFLIISITIIFILTSGCVNQSDNINSQTNKPDVNKPDIVGPPLNPRYLPTMPPTPEDTPIVISTPIINP
jgi:PBP1b-binding outer membrane lipoprotein LpoB